MWSRGRHLITDPATRSSTLRLASLVSTLAGRALSAVQGGARGPRGRTRFIAIGAAAAIILGCLALITLSQKPDGPGWSISDTLSSAPVLPNRQTGVPPGSPPSACVAGSVVSLNAIIYQTCNVTLVWPQGPPVLTENTTVINVTVEDVSFSVYAYSTVDCPVLKVTGHELNGPSSSFLIYPIPDGCVSDNPTVFSADLSFGATWYGGMGVELYAQADVVN